MDHTVRAPKPPLDKNVSKTNNNNVLSKRKYKNICLQVCFAILCAKFCERLAYYGLINSLTIYFPKVCVKFILIFTVCCILLSIECVNGLFEYLSLGLSIYAQTDVWYFNRVIDGTEVFTSCCKLLNANLGCIRCWCTPWTVCIIRMDMFTNSRCMLTCARVNVH